jgi:hypothetical protein
LRSFYTIQVVDTSQYNCWYSGYITVFFVDWLCVTSVKDWETLLYTVSHPTRLYNIYIFTTMRNQISTHSPAVQQVEHLSWLLFSEPTSVQQRFCYYVLSPLWILSMHQNLRTTVQDQITMLLLNAPTHFRVQHNSTLFFFKLQMCTFILFFKL